MKLTDHKKDLERIKNFCLMDDDFMTACFAGNRECTELVLRLILGREDLRVVEAQTQCTIKEALNKCACGICR